MYIDIRLVRFIFYCLTEKILYAMSYESGMRIRAHKVFNYLQDQC